MNKFLKALFFRYQKSMWYVAQFGAELGKPLRFWSETGMLVLILATFGFKMQWYQVLIGYGIILFTAVLMGWILTRMGVVAYNNQLSNKQNEDLQEILKRIKRIEARQEKRK